MKKIIFFITIIGIIFFSTSCSEFEPDLASQGDNTNAVFADETSAVEVMSTEGGKFSVQVDRGNTSRAEDVGVKLTVKDAPAGINFRLASNSASFAQGEGSTTVDVLYDYDAMEFFETYTIELSFTDASQGPVFGGNATTTVNVTKKLQYSNYVTAKFTSGFTATTADFFGTPIVDKEVTIQKADGANYFIIVDPYANNHPLYFVMNDDRTEISEFNRQTIGVSNASYGMVSFGLVSYTIDKDNNQLILTARSLIQLNGTWYYLEEVDHTLTMPAGFF